MQLTYSKGLRNRKIVVRDMVSGTVGPVDHFSLKKLWKGVKDVGRAVVNVSPAGAIKKAVTGQDLVKQKTKAGQKWSAKTSTTRKITGVAGLVIGGGIAAAPAISATVGPGVKKLVSNIKDVDPGLKNTVMKQAGAIIGKVIKDNTPEGYKGIYTDNQPQTAPKKAIQEINENPILGELSFTNPLVIAGIVISVLVLILLVKK